MPVNYEIKSQLAKLLATEDLVVENRNVQTAQFNVETRVLTLPMWKRASENVYDMLVGHEVGHALYTPNDWSFEDRVPRQFVNVTEDARIEKMMKRRYPGLSKSFYRGYQELAEDDFFCLEDTDIDTMNLADRINLHFKIGNFIRISFSPKEKEIVDLIADSETFADAVLAAEELYRFCKEIQKNDSPNGDLPPQKTDEEGNNSESKVESQSSSDADGKDDSNETDDQDSATGSSEQVEEPEVTTDQMFEEGSEEWNGQLDERRDPRYIEIPKVNLEEIIVPNVKIHQEIQEHWNFQEEGVFEYADSEYNKFKKSSQKEVNFMVKDFECKKSADAYSRSAIARTGVLDCSKLHTYKHNEDIFKKVTVIPDGKNHGLIFILDWSGSMSDCIIDTIKQLYNLIWFCNKVNIPFDVYAFTNNYPKKQELVKDWADITHQESRQDVFTICPTFSLMQFFTSDAKKSDIEKQMINIWRIVFSMKHYNNYSIPASMGLSGTPLNESIICLSELIPEFKKSKGVQKIQCVILTDGEAGILPHFRHITDYFKKEKLATQNTYAGSFVRNRKTGYTYKINHSHINFTNILLQNLKQMYPEVNLIGFRLCAGRDFRSFIRNYTGQPVTESEEKKMKKDKSYTIKSSGYDSLFAMLTSGLSNETEFDVEEGASKAKIKSAFVKNLKAKALNKKVLSQFMDLVC